MNLTHYRITINPVGLSGNAAAAYRRKVYEHLTWIYKTKSGKILLDSIRFHGRPVEIRPYTGGDCNAVGGGQVVGGNINGIVWYSPDTFSIHGACSATKSTPNSGLYWDEILFHELIHVFRNVSGKWNKSPLGFGLHRYDDTEEFFAVLATNIYISDRSNKIKSSLRASHQGFHPLSTDFDEAFEFYSASTQVFKLVDQFYKDNYGFFVRIANDVSTAPFNPLTDYLVDKERARLLSQNSAKRDIVGLAEQIQEFVRKLLK